MSFLHGLDRMKQELQAQFPGWHIWYVPKLDKSATWCAQPWPLINAPSPEHLIAEISQAHTEAAGDWPALASINDYAVHAPGIRRPEAPGIRRPESR